MLIYQGIKSSFIEDVNLGMIADKIREKYREQLRRNPSKREFISYEGCFRRSRYPQ